MAHDELYEVLCALDGREPPGGVFTSDAAQRVHDMKVQLDDALEVLEYAKKSAISK